MIRTYTETYDINTADGRPTLIGFHTPIGRNPYHFLYPAFMMYEKYRYLGCDISVVNSAHLPVSITAYDIEGGQANMDPRDSLNPILFRGCHGNSLGNVLNSIYEGFGNVAKESGLDKGEMLAQYNNFYYTALGDNGWRKSPISKTLRINGLHPLVYRQAMNIQMAPVNADVADYPENASGQWGTSNLYDGDFPGSISPSSEDDMGNVKNPAVADWDAYSNIRLKFGTPYSLFTNGVQKLGWMDTLSRVTYGSPTSAESPSGTNNSSFSYNKIQMLPKIFMGIMMLPAQERAYNFLRISIRHKFAFKNVRGISAGAGDPVFDPVATTWGYYEDISSVVPDSKERREKKGILPIKSTASLAMEPPKVDTQEPNASFETIEEQDNIELVNAKSN